MFPRTGEDDCPHGVVGLHGAEGIVQFGCEFRIEGVHGLGAVEGDGAYTIAFFP